jgi:predicted transglutaminase-like cysteine proteinase
MLILAKHILCSPCIGLIMGNSILHRGIVLGMLVGALFIAPTAKADPFSAMFGYGEVSQTDITVFPQWVNVMDGQDLTRANPTDLEEENWHDFLNSVRNKSSREQLDAVNRYVNGQDYVVDQKNYGSADHWAQPSQFLANGGDCEDFAILKFFSLRWLGWPAEKLRLVVVQDTKQRQPHAVLAVASGQDVLILDNQTKAIVSQSAVPHYAPVYSISDRQWWLHLPKS